MGLLDRIEEKEKAKQAEKIVEKQERKETRPTEEETPQANSEEGQSEFDDTEETQEGQEYEKEEHKNPQLHEMAGSDRHYSTEMDSMYNLVKSAKHIKLREVAKILNISNERADELAEILTRHKLITMHYPPIGPIELRAAGYHPSRKGIIGKIRNIF